MKQTRVINGGLDMDSAIELIAKGDYPKAVNMDLHRPNTGDRGFPHNSDSFDLAAAPLTHADDENIGGFLASDGLSKFGFYYNPDPLEFKIIMYSNGVPSIVAQTSALGFISTDRISSGAYVDDVLYYTDGRTDLKGIDLNNDPEENFIEDISLIKKPPSLPPIPVRSILDSDGSSTIDSNLIANKEFQFAWQFEYSNNQKSVLSPFSVLSHRDYDEEGNRMIHVKFQSNEQVPKYVNKLNLVVRENNIGVWRMVESKDISELPAGWEDFYFYNTKKGSLLESRYSNAFDLVPLTAEALTIADNRLWPANIKEGYDTPDISLTVAVLVTETAGGGQVVEYRTPVKIHDVTRSPSFWGSSSTTESDVAVAGYFVNLDGATPDVYVELVGYDPTDFPAVPTDPAGLPPDELYTVNESNTITLGVYNMFVTWPSGQQGVGSPLVHAEGYEINYDIALHSVVKVDNGLTEEVELVSRTSLIQDSSYQVGVLFSDFAGRKCGVYTDKDATVNTGNGVDSHKYNLSWELTDKADIPDWADTYSILMTKNLDKSFYIESNTTNICYSAVDEEGEKTRSYAVADMQFIEVDVLGMLKQGLGYEFKEGDRITLFDVDGAGTIHDLEIVGAEGSSIILPFLSLMGGSTSLPDGSPDPLTNVKFCIYTPIATNSDQLFYEIGQTYKIKAVDGVRDYTVRSGIYEGDTVVDVRPRYYLNTYDLATGIGVPLPDPVDQIFLSATMKGTDDEWVWNTNIGRGFIVTEDGQVTKPNYGRFSGNYISETKINALNEFDPAAEFFTPIENGAIKALKMASKAQGEGGVMLALGEYNTSSVYIGEVPMSLQQNTSFMVQTNSVVGGIETSPQRFGCIHPDSVLERDGIVFWYDYYNKAFVAHSGGKSIAISENLVRKHFRDMTNAIAETDLVVSGYDHAHDRFYVSFPTAGLSEFNTISYSISGKRWLSLHEFAPDLYIESTDQFSMVTGKDLFERDVTETCRYNGSATPLVLHIAFNDGADINKWFKTFSMKLSQNLIEWADGDQRILSTATVTVVIRNENGQYNTIVGTAFEVNEYMAHAAIMCDEANSGDPIEGDFIVSTAITAEITIDCTAKSSIRIISCDYEESLN